jgi:hypothetical protein
MQKNRSVKSAQSPGIAGISGLRIKDNWIFCLHSGEEPGLFLFVKWHVICIFSGCRWKTDFILDYAVAATIHET